MDISGEEYKMMQLSLDSCPAHAPHVVGQVVHNEAILILPDSSEVKVLNEVGAHIWELVDGQRTVREIAAAICTTYEVEPAQAEADTQAFVEDLLQRHILVLTR